MQTVLCKAVFYDRDAWYSLRRHDERGFRIIVNLTRDGELEEVVLPLGGGIEAMARFCNLSYSAILDLIQQAIRRLHTEEVLCGSSPRPAMDSCADTGACGL